MLGKSFPGTENWADGSSSVMGVRPFLGPRYIYSYVQLILGPFFIDGAIGLLGHSCITTLSHIVPYFRPPIIYSYIQLKLGPFCIHGAIGLPLGISYLYYHSVTYRT